MKTLEQYLRDAAQAGVIDHAIRASVTESGVSFYIHPSGKDGGTCDFVVEGDSVFPYPKITSDGGAP